jgi:hypothetical protein
MALDSALGIIAITSHRIRLVLGSFALDADSSLLDADSSTEKVALTGTRTDQGAGTLHYFVSRDERLSLTAVRAGIENLMPIPVGEESERVLVRRFSE